MKYYRLYDAALLVFLGLTAYIIYQLLNDTDTSTQITARNVVYYRQVQFFIEKSGDYADLMYHTFRVKSTAFQEALEEFVSALSSLDPLNVSLRLFLVFSSGWDWLYFEVLYSCSYGKFLLRMGMLVLEDLWELRRASYTVAIFMGYQFCIVCMALVALPFLALEIWELLVYVEHLLGRAKEWAGEALRVSHHSEK